jgi:cephalosporin-C deacetylase-like acetyl esterase
MRKTLLTFFLLAGVAAVSFSATNPPPPEAFMVFSKSPAPGPRITPYLAYQTELAWRQDDIRREKFEGIRDERDLFRVQSEFRSKLLTMIGGLPAQKTPLHSRITGIIQMEGFHIEKLLFQSLPGVYVTALVYVPDDGRKSHPAVLVPSGHAPNGKVHYQALCQRLVQRGYVVLSWDTVGQGERSQFWDAKSAKSRYNLICAEHAVLGNLAYLAGTNLARWEIWDGIRALDYLLTRPEVDPQRINITGTSGGGFQVAHIAALDKRIKVAAPSCYITVLPMRVYNRIFADPDSDPEQDLNGMISNGVDHPGLLLMMYPRPVFVAAAVQDFFPIEGTHKTFREVENLYARFTHSERIAMAESYNQHEFSLENQESALNFMDHFNQLPPTRGLPPVKELDAKALQCTRTGQVMLDESDARSLMDVIKEYYDEHKQHRQPVTLGQIYYGKQYAGIKNWRVRKYSGITSLSGQIQWEPVGNFKSGDLVIDRYLLHHSGTLEMPLLHIHKSTSQNPRVLLWFSSRGKAGPENWDEIVKHIADGYDVISFDFRGLGETRMPYKAISEDDPLLGKLDFDQAYLNPISGVLADYVYNSLLTGRPYFLQMIEDAEIAASFSRAKLNTKQFAVTSDADSYILSRSIAEALPDIQLVAQPNARILNWSEIVEQKRELWPIQYLLPDGAYIH